MRCRDYCLQLKLESIKLANERIVNDRNKEKKLFKLKDGDTVRSIPVESIMFFESVLASHKIILHLENGEIEF